MTRAPVGPPAGLRALVRRAPALAAFLALAAAGLAVYAGAFPGSYHLDDWYRVARNPGIEHFWPPWRHFLDPTTMATEGTIVQYRPLLPLSLSLDVALFGRSPAAHLAQNLAWQILAAWLVFLVVRELRAFPAPAEGLDPVALCVALLFLVHPVSSIPVHYICARDLTIMEVFLLAAFRAWIRMRRLGTTPRRQAAVCAWLALSLLGKTNAVVFPGLCLVFEATLGRRQPEPGGRVLRLVLPSCLVVLGFFAVTQFVLGFSDLQHVSPGREQLRPWLFMQARLHLLHYLPNFFYPPPIRFDPAFPWRRGAFDLAVAAGVLFIAAWLAGAWFLRGRRPLFSFALLAYPCLLIPTASFLPLHADAVDYRPYPGSPFFYLALALAAARLGPNLRRLLGAAAVAAAAGFTLWMHPIWQSEEALWKHSIDYGGGALAHHNYAMAVADLRLRARHLEQAIALNPAYVYARLNYARTLIWTGKEKAGLAELEVVRKLDPRNPRVRFWIGRSFEECAASRERTRGAARPGLEAERRRFLALAADEYLAAHRLAPRDPSFAYEAARCLERAERFADSLAVLDELSAVAGAYADAGFLRGYALQMLGRTREAIRSYRSFIASHPDHAKAWFNLGHALLAAKEARAAARAFERSLTAEPDQPAAHALLARIYESLGEFERAARHRRLAK